MYFSDVFVGQEFGAYRIKSSLGAGGGATVYRAQHRELRRDVALKVMDPTFDPHRFHQEARILARLHHPGIVPILDFGRESGHAYYAMPLVSHPTLEALLDDRRGGSRDLGEARSVMLTISLLEVLEEIHAHGFAHRDIKPSNIFVTGEDTVVLADFGAAKALRDHAGITQEGMILGTIPYMSPEQVEGRPLDVRTDIYSAGLVLYRMVCGRLPHIGSASDIVREKVFEGKLVRPRTFRPYMDPGLEEIILAACHPAPRMRIPDARTMRQRLQALLTPLPASATRRGRSSPVIVIRSGRHRTSPPRPRRMWRLALGFTAGMLLGWPLLAGCGVLSSILSGRSHDGSHNPEWNSDSSYRETAIRTTPVASGSTSWSPYGPSAATRK